jgi:hypothetical protein
VDRRQVDPAGRLAQHTGIATVVLETSLPDTERAYQRGGDHAHIMAGSLSERGNAEGLGARLQNHPRRWSTLEDGDESIRAPPPLADNCPIR